MLTLETFQTVQLLGNSYKEMVVDGEAVSIMNYIIQKRQREKFNPIFSHYVDVVDPIIIFISF